MGFITQGLGGGSMVLQGYGVFADNAPTPPSPTTGGRLRMQNCIVYQSVFDSSGQPVQQISNLSLSGISTNSSRMNTDDGKLYGTFTYDGPTDSSGTYSLSLYKDVLQNELVASAILVGLGIANVVPYNKSGITGSVNFAQYTGDDTNLVAVCCLSTDADLPLADLTTNDCNPIYGYAKYHLEAFAYIQQFILSRERSALYSPNYIDATFLNGRLGGLDLSKVLSFLKNPQTLRTCSAEYGFYRIAERQAIGNNMFMEKAKAYKESSFAALRSMDVEIDKYQQRQATESKSLRTFKMSRS